MIEVRQLTKHFGKLTAVDQLSFRVEPGQTLALIGTSGCGKTTTLKMINRLIEPSSGQVLVEGEDVAGRPKEELRRRMGYVIQHTGLFPHYSVEENIAVVPRLLKWEEKRIRQRTENLLDRLGLPPEIYARQYPVQLSGGQQQRVGIARALAADPPIILMDEPFGALDPITRRDVRRDFMELEELAGKTTILVTHDIEEAFEMADLICLLHQGKLQQIGTPVDLLFQPANEFVAQFLSGHQWSLQWELVTLGDLFDRLAPEGSFSETDRLDFQPDEPVKRAILRLIDGQTAGELTIGGQIKRFDTSSLLNAFVNFYTHPDR